MLRRLGYDVTVCGVHDGDDCVEGVPIRGLEAFRSRGKRMTSSWYRGLKLVGAIKADLYHFHDPELLVAAVLAKTFWGKKVVFDAHEDVGLILLKDWLPPWLRGAVAAIMTSVDRSFAARVDAVVVPTRRLAERYKSFAKRVETFHNFPAPELLRRRDESWLPLEQRRKEVVHLGTLSMVRLEFLLDLAAEFLARHEDWSWKFIGLHPAQYERFRERTDAGGSPRLTATGKVPHVEVAGMLCRARIGVNFHRLESRQVQVAIPLKVFEYLACGLSAVSTRVPLLVELVEACPAVRFCDETAESMLQQLDELAETDELEELGRTARKFSDERFNCLPEGVRLAELYEDILTTQVQDG